MGGTLQQGLLNNVIAPKYTLDEVLDFVLKEDRDNFDIESKEIVPKYNIDSNNISEYDFYRLANEVQLALANKNVDCILVTIGTDRLADVASLLEFTVRPANKPIIFTGAMHTIEDENTDVNRNIKNSLKLAEEILNEDLINKGQLYNGLIVVLGKFAFYAHSTIKITTTDENAFICSADKPLAAFDNDKLEINKVNILVNRAEPKMYLPKLGSIRIEDIQFGYRPNINSLIDAEAIIYVGTGDGNFPRSLLSLMEIMSYQYHKPQFVCSNVQIRNTLSNYEAGIVPDGVITSVLPLHSTCSKLSVILGAANFTDPKEKQDFVIEAFKKDLTNEYLHILGNNTN